MGIKIVTDISTFSSLKSAWDSLFSRCNQAKIFQSFEWNYTWWINDHANDKLFLLLYFEHGKNEKDPSAIFPFFIDKNGTLRFIADIHSDYSTFLIAEKQSSQTYTIFKEIQKTITEKSGWKSIELRNLSQRDPYIALFTTLFDHKQITFHSNGSSSLRLKPENDLSKCFYHLNSKKRSELKRIRKQYAETKSMVVSHPQPFPESTLKNLSETMIKSGMRDPEFLNDRLLNVIRAVYNAGNLFIHQISDAEGRPLAVNLILPQQNNNFLFWIDLFIDTKNINLYSYLAYIEHLCKTCETVFTIDFGRGLYDYKIKNFLPVIELQYSFYYAKKNSLFATYLIKLFSKLLIKNFYKKHKKIINRLLQR
jgi:hypothetical protein